MLRRLSSWILLCLLTSTAHANVLGDMQTFAPNSDGLDFITIHTSRPLNKGYFALGGHLSFAKDHLLVYKDLNTQEKYDYRDQLAEFDFTIAYGLTNKASVFFAVPNLIYQESDSGQTVITEVSKGAHTYRPGVKYTFGESPDDFAFIGSIDVVNVTNNPYTGVDDRPIYNLELAKTFRSANTVNYGLNVGYRLRTPTARPADAFMFPLDDQLIFSMGRSAPLFSKSRWVLEGIFSYPAVKKPYIDALDASSADILLGFKHRWLKNLNVDGGMTFEPFVETLAPRWRVFVGLVYYFNPGWLTGTNRKAPPPQVAPANVMPEEEVEEKEDTQSPFPPLDVTPQFSEVFEGTVVRYTISGGVGPYTLRIIRGRGTVNSPLAFYRAPLMPEKALIEISDVHKQTIRVEVVVKKPRTPNETIRIRNLNFIFDTDRLIESSKKEIARILGLFQNKKVSRIVVEGHTDSKGSDEYNLQLSEKRANTVARYLVEGLNLGEDQVNAIGFGELRPVATNATEKGRRQNRRVDLKVYYNK